MHKLYYARPISQNRFEFGFKTSREDYPTNPEATDYVFGHILRVDGTFPGSMRIYTVDRTTGFIPKITKTKMAFDSIAFPLKIVGLMEAIDAWKTPVVGRNIL